MRFGKYLLAVSLLQVCFMLAVRSAKADTIQIIDNVTEGTVTVTLLPSSGQTGTLDTVTGTPCTADETACNFNITRTFGGASFTATTVGFLASYTLAESLVPAGTNEQISDSLNVSNGTSSNVALHFDSDIDTNAPGFCSPLCSDVENANGNTAPGTISWGGGPVIDTVQIFSDIGTTTVPEPASLILFGSGLAMAGGFLRRRRRVV